MSSKGTAHQKSPFSPNPGSLPALQDQEPSHLWTGNLEGS